VQHAKGDRVRWCAAVPGDPHGTVTRVPDRFEIIVHWDGNDRPSRHGYYEVRPVSAVERLAYLTREE
jgi:hypothetical protein